MALGAGISATRFMPPNIARNRIRRNDAALSGQRLNVENVHSWSAPAPAATVRPRHITLILKGLSLSRASRVRVWHKAGVRAG